MKEQVYNNLKAIKKGIIDYDYDIETDFKNYIEYIKLGKTYADKLKIFIMCYKVDTKLEELNNWTIIDILRYIKNTDSCNNRKYIAECFEELERGVKYE